MTQPLQQIAADVAECKGLLEEALHGKPSAGQPGIWIRLDRLEQVVKAALFVASTAMAASVAAVVSAFTGHK